MQPPATVDHAPFTDAQLALYGLPHRAKGESLTQWQRIVRAAKHGVCTAIQTNLKTVMSTGPSPNTIDEASSFWSGNIAIDYGYTEAVGQWNVPCLTLILNNATALEWAGLGGDGDDGGGNLIQSGTVAQEYAPWGIWTAQYYAWFQDTGVTNGVQWAFNGACGDEMYADDRQDYSGGNPTAAHMYIEDVSNGVYASHPYTIAFSNGSTAEWILERGINWGDPNYLADFHTVNFTDCFAIRNGLTYSPINLPHNYSNM